MSFKKIADLLWIMLGLTVILFFQNCGSAAGPTGYTKDADQTKKSFDFDITGPSVLVTAAPTAYSGLSGAHFEVIANDNGGIGVDRMEYQLDDSGKWIVFHGILDLTSLGEGDHKIFFRAYDLKGNEGAQKLQTWTVDSQLPTISFSAKPALETTSSNANFTITVADNHGIVNIQDCLLNDISVTDCDSSVSFISLDRGYYTFSASAVDGAGNTKSLEYSWVITDSTGALPPPEFEVVPNDYVNTSTVTLKLRPIVGAGFTLVCKLDGVAHTCSPGTALTINVVQKMSAGKLVPYVFTATVTKGGKSATATRSWRVDKVAPVLVFNPEVASRQVDNKVTVHIHATDNAVIDSVSCTIDGVTKNCINDQDNLFDNLAAGAHTLLVTVKDKAGNTTTEMRSWENPACSLDDLNMRFPIDGVEGQDWALLDSFDRDQGSTSVKDFMDAIDENARASDNNQDITITTGDARTLLSGSAKVYAVEDGTVEKIVRNQPSDKVYTGASYTACTNNTNIKPNMVVIKHKNGFRTIYSYLQDVSSSIVVNGEVAKGQQLGNIGMSGCLKYPQLVFQTRNCSNHNINPIDKKRFGSTITENRRNFGLVNVTMHHGSLDAGNNTDLNKIMVSPEPKNTFPRNSSMTITGFVDGGIKSDVLIADVIVPGASRATRIGEITHGQNAGRFFIFHSGTLSVKGTWTWRLYQEKLNFGIKTTDLVKEISFTVN